MKHILTLFSFFFFVGLSYAQLPEGFARETILTGADGLNRSAGYIPVDTNLAYVYDLDGVVWAVLNEEILSEPLLDIREECGFWESNGLLGATIDPNFKENGYIYLLYNADRHHILYFGTPEYDPEANSNNMGGMGRITRFTVNTDDYLTADPSSRHVLLGNEIGSGIPICSDSHSTCGLAFGNDGSLLAATGDANSWRCCYTGVGELPPVAFDSISLGDGIINQAEMIGSFRSQFTDGLNGKVLRIHPETGEGLPNNPHYDENNPDADRGRWWAMGFRNPFRFKVRPNTGWGDLENGHPGSIYLGDVGNARWEELNIIVDGGGNYGWPLFEGHVPFDDQGYDGSYPDKLTYNLMAPNPLFEEGSCDQEYFYFQDLIQQPNEQHDYFFPNPCSENASIPENVLTFEHERPALAYRNIWGGGEHARFPTFGSQGEATWTAIQDMEEVEGIPFKGTSIIGGDFLTGPKIPEEYQDSYIFADYTGWIRAIGINENDEIKSIAQWGEEDVSNPVDLTFNKYDGCLYITSLNQRTVDRICFGGNLKPVPLTENDTIYGPSPMNVNFNGSESYDPEGGSITYQWDFGDGTAGEGPAVDHEYSGNGVESYIATLTVTDSIGATNEKEILISLNNTPPEVEIISVTEGQLYAIDFPSTFELAANVIDAESAASEMTYEWKHLLHHNTHYHVLHEYDFSSGITLVNPTGCGETDVYWYELNVRVVDQGGLTSFDSKMIYPDCDGELENETGTNELRLFPNPTSDVLTILSNTSLGEMIELRIIDVAGRLVRSDEIRVYNDHRLFRISVEELPNGVYTLDLICNGKREQRKFVRL
ncbi:PQQ-dependent sugar dehydrogenase [Cryomorphaceae bacterium 1068]|nr:PQQ-dependent sugar dehydrogenase [Cryomorphaceae bacterium 1068]